MVLVHEKIELLNERVERESCTDKQNFDCVDFDNNPSKIALAKKCEQGTCLCVNFDFNITLFFCSEYNKYAKIKNCLQVKSADKQNCV